MAVKASGRFVPPSAFAAGTGKAFTGAYAWNAPREAVGRERPLTRDEMRQVQGVLSTINRLTGLIESLSPSGRRRLSAELAKRLRQSQQRRVMAQKAPDGTPYAPRQQQSARKKTGRVKRKMFAKLITSRFLHIRASPEQASMEFYGGKSPKIASVHQFGLSEENRKDGKKIDYPARPLLGFTGEDVQMIEEIILAHLDR